MDEGALLPEVRHHTDSANVDVTGVWSEGDAFYPGRPVAPLLEQVALQGATMERRESAKAVIVAFAAR